jgi:transcriptional regulator with XRE-family HTH domain
MIGGMTSRRRPTELMREATRRTTSIAIALGETVRAARRRMHLTQHALAERIGMSQTWISRIERGQGAPVPLETWVALGVALDRPLAVSFSRPLLPTETATSDAGHLDIQEHVLALAKATGRPGTFELPTRPSDPARSTDVGIRDPQARTRILAECWNSFGDLGAAVRATNRKQHEAQATWPEDRIATVWVVRATAANRAVIARYPHIIDAAFPGSSRRWIRALTHGEPPPAEPGLVWFDPATGRLTERRRATIAP